MREGVEGPILVGGFPCETSNAVLQHIFQAVCDPECFQWHRARQVNGKRHDYGFLVVKRLSDVGPLLAALLKEEDDQLYMVVDSSMQKESLAIIQGIKSNGNKVMAKCGDAEQRQEMTVDDFKTWCNETLARDDFRENERKQQNLESSVPYLAQKMTRIQPQSKTYSDEMYEDLKNFRYQQAVNDVLEDKERKRQIMRKVRQMRELQNPPTKQASPRSHYDTLEQERQQASQAPVHVGFAGSIVPVHEQQQQQAKEKEQQQQQQQATQPIEMKMKPTKRKSEATVSEEWIDDRATKQRKFGPIEDIKRNLDRDRVRGIICDVMEKYLGQVDDALVSVLTEHACGEDGEAKVKEEVGPILEEDAEAFTKDIFQQL